jgi:hypothetical protein
MSSVAEQGGQSSGQQETGPNKITGRAEIRAPALITSEEQAQFKQIPEVFSGG